MWSLAIVTLPAGTIGEYTSSNFASFPSVNNIMKVNGIIYALKESMEVQRLRWTKLFHSYDSTEE